MTLQSITNRAMWAAYTPKGEIVFATIADTKEESVKLFDNYYSPELKAKYRFELIAIDIEVIERKNIN